MVETTFDTVLADNVTLGLKSQKTFLGMWPLVGQEEETRKTKRQPPTFFNE